MTRFPSSALACLMVLIGLGLVSSGGLFGAGSTGSVTITGTAEVGQTLTASNTLSDPDGLGAITYQWYRGGYPIVYGGTLKDGLDGVDGLNAATGVTLSSDGNHAYVTGWIDDAVSWYERNASSGALTYGGMLKDGLDGVDGLDGARVFTLSSDGKHAYVTGELSAAVSWYERNASTGALTYGGTLKDGVDGVVGLDGAIGVTLSADGNHVYVAGKDDNAVSWYERNATTGALTYGGMLQDGVNGVDGLNGARGLALSADGNHIYITGATDDAVSWYERNASTGALTYGGMLKDGVNGVDGLNGAWNMILSADGKHAYVTGYTDDAVSWYDRNASTGALTYGGVLQNGVNGVDGLDGAWSVTLSADGKHAYATSWTDDAVSWYERNASTGELSYGGMLKDGVDGVDGLDGAGGVILASDGNYAYVTGWNDDAVSWYERNASTGALSYFIADQSTYTLTLADAGSVISVVASYTDGGGNFEQVHSAGISLVQSSNTIPTDLNSTAPLTVAENQPIGTVVGEFNATDPDANATLTYYFVSGVGDGNNSLFTLDANGTLRTATTFDYEKNASTYTIRVQVRDEYNATSEGNFTVILTNLNEPATGAFSLTGTPVVGQTLAASNDLADPDGLGAITYQWYRDGQPILYGGTLKDGANGVDGLDGNMHLALSGDGKHAYYVSITNDSVNWFEINASTGALSYRGVLKDNLNGVDGLDYASWLTISNDGKHVYVTGYEDSAVSWYDRNANTGALTYGGMLKDGVNGVDGLNGAWRGTFASDGKYLYLAGSLDNSVSWFERNATTGALTYLGMLKDGVNGVDGLAGAQNVKLSPDGNHAYVTGINDHAVSWFDRNGATGILTYGGTLKDGVNGVDGLEKARNLTLSPDGLFVYVTAENDDAVSWYGRNASTGALTYLGHLKDGVGGIDNLDYPWEVTISSDGAFAYVDSIYENAITWFERNASTGALSYKGHVKEGSNGVEGLHGAGTLVLSGNGLYAYSGGHVGGTAIWFARDPVTGALSYAQTGSTYVPTPADAGSVITVTASYTDGGSFEHNVSSGGTAAIQPIYVPSQPNHFVDLNATVNLEMIWVEPGTFAMGSPTSEVNRHPDETVHNVTITKGFYLGKYEVTQAQYEAVMKGNGNGLSATPSQFGGNPNRPVEKVSWDDIQIFLTRLNSAEQTAGRLPTGWSYVLPTEAQWEYACRAGTNSAYSWGNTISSANANYDSNSGIGQTTDVGQYAANPWGFFDMHGNIGEWISDWYDNYDLATVQDPSGSLTGTKRVKRGGSYVSFARHIRAAERIGDQSNDRRSHVGFRLGFQQTNTTPSNLFSTAPLTIAENQPIGSVVVEFNATDPDAGASLTYHLVSGAGDGNNSLFTLETNGTLKTATTFDYETNASTYSIRVQAKDEFNATVEGNFTVTLSDLAEDPPGQPNDEGNSTNENNQTGGNQSNPENNETTDQTNPVVDGNTTTDPTNPGVDGNSTNEGNATVPSPVPDYSPPIVDTLPAGEVNGTSAKLHGALMDTGGQAPTERGFLLSFRPNPKENGSGVIRLVVESNASAFSVDATALQAGKKYHYRAYVRNGQGTGFGLVETFVTPSGAPSPSWIDAQPGNAAGWWTSPWLGSFFLAENGWVRHKNLGWVFPVESPTAGLWLWKKDLGWLWTDKEIYPFLYRNVKGAWLYFFGLHGEGSLLFYDYGAKAWIKGTDNR